MMTFPIFDNHDVSRLPIGHVTLTEEMAEAIARFSGQGAELILGPAVKHTSIDTYELVSFGLVAVPSQERT